MLDRDLAKQVIDPERELAEACGAHPDRFVAFATRCACSIPILPPSSSRRASRSTGCAGPASAATSPARRSAIPKFHPFWAKAEQLGVLVFIHPQGDGAPAQLQPALQGQWLSEQCDRQPARDHDRALASDLRGHARQFPGLKICAAHAGGYLPSYAGRFDHGCPTRPDLCPGGTHGTIKKKPTEYLKQLYYDTMVFTPEACAISSPRSARPAHGRHRLSLSRGRRRPWT